MPISRLTARAQRALRTACHAVAVLVMVPGGSFAQQSPTVGVMDFTNAAMIKRAEFAPIAVALTELLSGQLATNQAVTVVERARLHRVLDEQGLVRGGQVDPATAAQLGKLLGAQYMLFGVVVVDLKERIRIDVRAVDVSTSRVVTRHTVEDRDADDVLQLLDRLAAELNRSLKLPGVPVAAPEPPPTMNRTRQRVALSTLARALVAEETPGKADSARALFREVLDQDERMTAARLALTRLGGLK